jgi:hypothetical protein
MIGDISIHDPSEWTIFRLILVSPALLSRFNAKGNVDASSLSKTDCRSSRRFSIISRSSLGRSVWSSLRQRQISFRTDLISLKLSSMFDIASSMDSKLTQKTRSTLQFFSEPPLYEGAFNISQLSVEEPTVSPHICLAGPP